MLRVSIHAHTDSDLDGLPDVWENQHGLQALPDGSTRFSFPALSGCIQHIEWTDHLGRSWQRLANNLTATRDHDMVLLDTGDAGRSHPAFVDKRHYLVVYELP